MMETLYFTSLSSYLSAGFFIGMSNNSIFSEDLSLSLSLSSTHQQIQFYLEGINRVVHVVQCFQGFYGVSATPLLFQKQINMRLYDIN